MSAVLDDAVAAWAAAVDADPNETATVLARELEADASLLAHSEVPEADRVALGSVATPADVDGPELVVPWLRGEAVWQQMCATAVALTAAADRLGVSASALRRVIGTAPGEGVELLGFKTSAGHWRVFEFQLPDQTHSGGEPATTVGRRTQRVLPPGMDPVAVAAWWDAPNPGLVVDGRELTPRRWIVEGLDPDRLMTVAEWEDAT